MSNELSCPCAACTLARQHIWEEVAKKRTAEGVNTNKQQAVQTSAAAVSPRETILNEAKGIVMKDRNSVYGDPEDNFKDIAALWAAYKGISFTSMDVVVMNMLIKVARLKKTPEYHDGLVDIAGYAACGGDIQRALRSMRMTMNTAQSAENSIIGLQQSK